MKLVLAEKPSVHSPMPRSWARTSVAMVMVMQQVAKRDALFTSIQQSEKRLAEIGTLKKHIINYSKTRSTYEEYRKVGYSKKFLERIGKKSLFTKQPKRPLTNWA